MNELYDYDSEGRADKKLETIISAEIERKSFKLALEILRNSIGINQIINLNNIDWCDLQTHQCLISACRKAAIDNFPLHDYAMGEIASVTDEYMIMNTNMVWAKIIILMLVKSFFNVFLAILLLFLTECATMAAVII